MNLAGTLLAWWLWCTAGVAAAGVAWKAFSWLRTPVLLPMPLPSAPATRTGAAFRLVREGLLFETLFRANGWTWFFGWAFHAALLLVAVRHLWLFLDPVPGWMVGLIAAGGWLSAVLIASLAGLLGRRLFVERVRYVSVPSDYLMLLLLLVIAGSGAWLGHAAPGSLGLARRFALGLAGLEARPLPADPVLWLHLGGAGLLIVLLPFSKLLHAPGVFLTPTRRRSPPGPAASPSAPPARGGDRFFFRRREPPPKDPAP